MRKGRLPVELYGTLGASCARREILERMFQAGMTGARLNLSHTTLRECAALLEEGFWPAARRMGVEASLIIDLQGPELRVGRLKEPVELKEGEQAVLGAGGLPVPQRVVEAACPGDQISLDDSALQLTVREKLPGHLVCRVERGGVLKSRKSLALLGREVDAPTLTEEDRDNLALAERYGSDPYPAALCTGAGGHFDSALRPGGIRLGPGADHGQDREPAGAGKAG